MAVTLEPQEAEKDQSRGMGFLTIRSRSGAPSLAKCPGSRVAITLPYGRPRIGGAMNHISDKNAQRAAKSVHRTLNRASRAIFRKEDYYSQYDDEESQLNLQVLLLIRTVLDILARYARGDGGAPVRIELSDGSVYVQDDPRSP